MFVCGGLEAVAEIYCATGYARRRRRMRRFLQSVEGIRVDGLEEVWVSAAEERLISRGVVEDLDEVGCCGRFVSGLLMAGQDSDSEEDEEEDSDEDEE